MKRRISDEELLSYLMGDGDEDLLIEIEQRLESEASLHQRLEGLKFLKQEIKREDFSYSWKRESRPLFWAKQFAFSLLILFIGIQVEARYQIAGHKAEELKTSQPLSWDESKTPLM